MSHKLHYGSEIIEIPAKPGMENLTFNEPKKTITEEGFLEGIKKVLPTIKNGDRVAIVVSDKTRLCSYAEFLPVLTTYLLTKVSGKENITFYIAYGTHPPQRDEESIKTYGEVFNEFSFVHHDCTDEPAFKELGTTKRGTPIKIRKDLFDYDLIITMGAISHHYFAGFGGGRKLFFPGLAYKHSIYHNHGLFLDRQKETLSSTCQPGVMDDNPIAEDFKEMDSYFPPRISIHGIMDTHGNACDFIFGKNYSDFEMACEVHDRYYKLGSDKTYDLVVASAGGYPKDINYIQAHKAIHNAAAFVKDNGTLLLFMECRDGIASKTFLPYFEMGGMKNAFNHLANNYEGNGGTALSTMIKAKRINIKLITKIDKETCSLMGMEQISIGKAKEIIASTEAPFAFISNASMLVK